MKATILTVTLGERIGEAAEAVEHTWPFPWLPRVGDTVYAFGAKDPKDAYTVTAVNWYLHGNQADPEVAVRILTAYTGTVGREDGGIWRTEYKPMDPQPPPPT